MSIQTLPSPVTFRARSTARRAPVDRMLLIAAGLFLVVLIAEAIVVAVAAPSLTDIGALYVTTT